VGGHGILGSASSSLVGVSTLGYPSGLADPLDSSVASEGQITAESAIATATSTAGKQPITSRQPPTAAEVTAAAFSSPTLAAKRQRSDADQPQCVLSRDGWDGKYDTIRYFNVRSKADLSQLNLPHGNNN